MKLESAEPGSDMHKEIGSEGLAGRDGEPWSTGSVDGATSHHDIRASLAIINGYSAALQSSFQELRELYNEVVEHQEGVTDETSRARLMTLEADCRFCLSRMCDSVEQLKKRLETEAVLQAPSQE